MSVAPDMPVRPPAARKPLGPQPHANGVAFRVWAPNAEAVAVVGSFNDWNAESHPMTAEPGGFWHADVPGARPGDQYRYRIRYGGKSFTKIDPRARNLTDTTGNGVVHDPEFDWEGDDFTPAAIESLVLYEMHVGTFHAADDRPGTFATAAGRLGHLRDLGVNGVTLMPVTEFPGRGWGYDVTHLYAVRTAYGGPRGLKEFVKAAHRHGIAVFLDVVYNHLSPKDLDLWWFDGWHEGDRGGIYFYQDDRADTPWGPRPDVSRPEVREFLLDNVRLWLGEYRVDGLRVDGTFHLRTASKKEEGEGGPLAEGWSLLCEMTDLARREFPRAILTAEDMRGDPRMTRPTSEGGAGFHAQWSDRFAQTGRMASDGDGLSRLRGDRSPRLPLAPEDAAKLLARVRDSLLIRYDGDPFARVIFGESHDNAGKDGRVPALADPDDPESPTALRWNALAATLVLTAPGVPQLFQGQELLDPRDFEFEEPHPLDLARVDRFGGVLRLHRDLIALRRNLRGTTAGLTGRHVEVVRCDADLGLLAYRRWRRGGPGDDVLVVANVSDEPRTDVAVEVPEPGTWRVRLNTDSAEYGGGLGATMLADIEAEPGGRGDGSAEVRLSVGPYSAVVLSQDPG